MPESELLSAWLRFSADPGHPFMIPGHKHRAGDHWAELGLANRGDVPLFGGLAPVKEAAEFLRRAETRAASLWGADWCRYSTGGSTHANQALALAVGQPGDEVLVARNAHRSTLSGLILAGITPRWVAPEVNDGLITGLTPAAVEAALSQWPDAKALFLVEPSYVGTLSDVAALAEVAHANGLTVVVDQAWGAHLGFHQALPPHALTLGADALITSAHKTLPAYSQGSIVLAQTERLDAGRLERAFDLGHTTSPAGSILASTDAAVALLANTTGHRLLGELIETASAARRRLRTDGMASGLLIPGPDTHRMDPTKLVIQLPGGGLVVEQALLDAGLAPEQADENTIIPILTMVDRPGDVDRLINVLLGATRAPRTREGQPNASLAPLPPAPMTPREAFFAATATVDAGSAIGKVSAEVIAPYPPGVPVLVPGEEITATTIDALRAAAASGVRIAYAADPTLATFQVVA